MMGGFSEEVRHVLMEAGWRPGRRVRTRIYSLQLTAASYQWFPAVAAFLREFGGLHLQFLRRDGSMGTLQFTPLMALQYQTPAQVQHYTQHLAPAPLCLIGQAYAEHLMLLMDAAGVVYGSFDHVLFRVGATGREAIEAICRDLEFQELRTRDALE